VYEPVTLTYTNHAGIHATQQEISFSGILLKHKFLNKDFIMFEKGGLACCLILNPPGEVGPPISSSVVLCSFVRLVCKAVL
jgi:hypothetical protein